MVARALDVVFPPRCAGCGAGAWPFCQGCVASLQVLAPPWCERCGRPPLAVARCGECPAAPVGLTRSPFLYTGAARAAIHRLKFSGWRTVAAALADAMVAVALPAVEAVTWVPLARRRLGERGYDQARALAHAVAGRLDLPLLRLTERVVDTGPQARRSGQERRVAMGGAFDPLRRMPVRAPRSVVLVDDVLTTGSTASACADALVRAGVQHVVLLTAARAFSGRGPVYTRSGSQPGLWLPGDLPR